jgi:hypothetical protein
MSELPDNNQSTPLDEKVESITTPLMNEHITITGNPFSPDTTNDPAVSIYIENDRQISDAEIARYNAGVGEEGEKWLNAVQEAVPMNVKNGMFLDRLSSGDWKPYITSNGSKIGPSSEQISFQTNGGLASGERAALRIQQLRGAGQCRTFPLFRSGLWLRMRPIGDGALADAQTQMLLNRVKLGRMTNGLLLSSTMSYMVESLLRLVITHVTESNLKENNLAKIPELLRVSDLMALAGHAAQSLYPKGFVINRVCTLNPASCEHVDRTRFQPAYMTIHDDSKLTPTQKAYMHSGIDYKRTPEMIKSYQSSFEEAHVYKIDDVITVVLGDPTVEEFLRSADDWIDGIIANVDSLLSEEYDDDQRNQQIQMRARQTMCRQYAGYVREIQYQDRGEDVAIRDRETINIVINDLCSSEESSKKLAEAVREVQSLDPVSIVGIPRYNCPVCQRDKPMTEEQKSHPFYTPVDAIQLFFILQRLRLHRLHSKSLNSL